MAAFDKQVLYLVQEVTWELDEEGDSPRGRWLCPDLSFGKPEAIYTSRAVADAEAQRLEQEAREEKSPFCHGESIEDRTSMPEGVFLDWLTDAGIDPPDVEDDEDWADWWETSSRRWSRAKREKVWEALDRVRFFRVVELPPPG